MLVCVVVCVCVHVCVCVCVCVVVCVRVVRAWVYGYVCVCAWNVCVVCVCVCVCAMLACNICMVVSGKFKMDVSAWVHVSICLDAKFYMCAWFGSVCTYVCAINLQVTYACMHGKCMSVCTRACVCLHVRVYVHVSVC